MLMALIAFTLDNEVYHEGGSSWESSFIWIIICLNLVENWGSHHRL